MMIERGSPRIISASRRTDIPAYYSEWFMRRVDEGHARWRNPFGGAVVDTSLAPDDIAAFIFWSKNYAPMLPHLQVLYDRGYRFICHFTITGLPSVFEPRVPPAEEAVDTAWKIAARFSPEVVLWRYDPVLISSITDAGYHRRRFAEIAARMEGLTRRCYFSFPTFYGKTIRNTGQLQQETGVRCLDLPVQEKTALSEEFAEIAGRHGITMYSCCGEHLVSGRIKKAHCVDAELLFRLYPHKMINARLRPSRKECGCYESTDIGAYDTCPHGCVYCYANTNKEVAERRWKEHEPGGEAL